MGLGSLISGVSAIVPDEVLKTSMLRRFGESGALGAPKQPTAGVATRTATFDPVADASRVRLLGSQFQALATRDAFLTLSEKLSALDAAAQKLGLSSSSAVFRQGTSAWSSDSDILRIDSAPSSLSAPLQVNVLQLANSTTGQQAIIEINGKQFASDTNQFTDAGGIAGLDITVLRTTSRTVTSTTVTPGSTTTTWSSPVAVKSFNASSEKLRLEDDEGFETGDAVKFFNSSVEGISGETIYYAKVDGSALRLYGTREQAQAGGSEGRIDIGSGTGGGFQNVSGMSVSREITVTTPDTVTTKVTRLDKPVTITPGGDSGDVAAAIRNYVKAYNEVQQFLQKETAPDGALANESSVGRLASQLRRAVSPLFRNAALSGVASEEGGSITLDSTKLERAVAANYDTVVKVFANSTTGIASRTAAAIDPFEGAQGIVAQRTAALGAILPNVEMDKLREAQAKWNQAVRSFDSIAEAMVGIQGQTEFLKSLTSLLL